MIKIVNNILQDTLKTDVDYLDLAEDFIKMINNNNMEYNYLIDSMQILIIREAYRFMTYLEVEELYHKIKGAIE